VRRRPRWLPLVAAASACALFAGLGTWQLQRAAEREAELAAIQAAEQRPAVDLPAGADLDALAWRSVRLEGRFLRRRQFLLDNRTLAGRPGFVVLTPFVLVDGRSILVDRGWVAADGREPARPIRLPAAGEQPREIEGRLWRPQAGFGLGPAIAEGATDWPRMTTRVDYAALGEALGRPLVPAVVRADGEADWMLQARPLEPRFRPERHLGYAFQWFALAATVVIVTLLLGIRAWWRDPGREAE